MKKFLAIFAVLIMTLAPNLTFAGEVNPWAVSILEVYIEKGEYYSDMTKAVRRWITPMQGRLFVNIQGTRIKQRLAHIEFYFDSKEQDGIFDRGLKTGDRPYISININTEGLSDKEIQSKLLHWAGISLGANESENEDSVMFKTPKAEQKILDEDMINLKNLYHVKVKAVSVNKR